MKITEKNIGELYTTDGKDVYQYMGELTIVVQRMKNLITGEFKDVPDLDKYVPLVADKRFKKIEQQPEFVIRNNVISTGEPLIENKAPRKQKATRAICNSCALTLNCDHAANLQPDGTCKAYDKKS